MSDCLAYVDMSGCFLTAFTYILIYMYILNFVCGVTGSFVFAFMFPEPVLYLIYVVLYGIFTVITTPVGFRAGFSSKRGLRIFGSRRRFRQQPISGWPFGTAAFVAEELKKML